MKNLKHLPGAELVEEGLKDLRSGKRSVLSFLVLSAETRLRWYGVDVPHVDFGSSAPAHAMYDLLCEQHGSNAYSLYNSYRRRLVSLMRAMQCRS